MRVDCFGAALGLAVLLGAGPVIAKAPDKPNVIVILADDLGLPDVSAYGHASAVPTPNIDRIGAEGVRFERGYVTASVCSPSRAGLLSGQYPQRHGFEHLAAEDREGSEGGLLPEQRLLPEDLKRAGYATVGVGKWHLGLKPDQLPTARGFDRFYGFLGGETAYADAKTPGVVSVSAPYLGDRSFTRQVGSQVIGRWRAGSSEKEVVANDDRYVTAEFTAEAIKAIKERRKNQPFFLYVAYSAPHSPFQATQADIDRFAHISDPLKRTYAAMLASMDDGVGRILDTLSEEKIDKNTIVVFLADNGAATYFGISDCSSLSGGKLGYYEGGARVPLLMRWPAKLDPGKVERRNVSSLDIYPTVLAAAGLESQKPLDGVDLVPRMQPGDEAPIHEMLFWRTGQEFAALSGDWKLFSNTRAGAYPWLFNLSSDPSETENLLFKNRDQVTRLMAGYKAWSAQMKPSAWKPRETIQVMECGRVVFHEQ